MDSSRLQARDADERDRLQPYIRPLSGCLSSGPWWYSHTVPIALAAFSEGAWHNLGVSVCRFDRFISFVGFAIV